MTALLWVLLNEQLIEMVHLHANKLTKLIKEILY